MPRLAPALVGLSLIASPVAADVTPREVWDDWLAAAEEDAAEITTEAVEETPDGLVVRGVTLEAGSDEEGSYRVEVDEITLTQNADGTVGVTASPAYPVVLTDIDDEGTLRQTTLQVRHPDLELTVDEDEGRQTHAFSAPEIRVAIDEATADGEPLDISGDVVLSDVSGHYDVDEALAGDSALTASEVQVSFDGTDPEGGNFDFSMSLDDVESTNMLQLVGPSTADLARGLPEGESRDGSLRVAETSFSFEGVSEGETVALSGTSGPGEAELGVSSEGLRYASTGEGAKLSVSGSTIPLPEVMIDIGSASSTFAMPLLGSEQPQPYAFGVSMLDVSLDEGLWNMIDPAGILPRDPGAVVVDVSGDMTVEDDVDATGVGEEMTGQIDTVSVNAVRLAMAGSEVLATGLLTLADTAAGEVRPVGEIDVTLTGAAQLLTRLVQVGLVPEEQAMGAQMMLGMFAKPGAGDDELVSQIRFGEGGELFVNDQQIR